MNVEDLIKVVDFTDFVLSFNKDGSEFQKLLISMYPKLEADIKSASIHPNCSCVSTLNMHFDANRKGVAELVLVAIERGILDEQEVELKLKSHTDKNISGKVAKTSLKEWPSFVKNLKDGDFKFAYFNVVKEGDELYVLFF